MRGYKTIIRFDTIDIKYNINACINEIKKILTVYTGEQYELRPENPNIDQYKKNSRDGFTANLTSHTKLDKVYIYAASHALSYDKGTKGAIAFQLVDIVKKRHSEVFVIAYSCVNIKRCQSLSVLEALRKMKKPSEITIYTNSKWLAGVCNRESLGVASKKLSGFNIFALIDKELSKHNYKFIYLPKMNGVYNNDIFRPLISRAKQAASITPDDERICYIASDYLIT